MTAEGMNQLIAGLLVLMVLCVLLVGVGLVFFARVCSRRSRSQSEGEASDLMVPKPPLTRLLSAGFNEAPARWFAVRSQDLDAVQSALELHNPTPCSWGEGMAKLDQFSLFIAPPFQGWILVVGQAVPDPAEDVDECFRFVARLSRALGSVQFFSLNRALNHHAWVRAEDGRIERAYAWAGETVWNQGPVTDAERKLKLHCFEYGSDAESSLLQLEILQSNTDKVPALAARWSFDPGSIDVTAFRRRFGIAGDLAHSR